ncbi:hypothetical protein EVAR_10340_1 [Eumeta japonica]|uniref:Mutator-like transposase domain-containing protein n=1 Tax=Eumeta variegata TaxID=151549 RepID=A0A4C1TDX7_EUMVA|nr:hypothetical protein EVAR_10340_1 [Eumeta japonica]
MRETYFEFKVSGDETLKMRFKIIFSVTTLLGYYSGKVVDLVVQSSYCQSYIYWEDKPKNSTEYLAWKDDPNEEHCMKTHENSAGSMKVEFVKIMLRSDQQHGVQYSNYIGDGDSKTFTTIVNLNPYDDELTVVTSECIGHVQKRMGTVEGISTDDNPKHDNCPEREDSWCKW